MRFPALLLACLAVTAVAAADPAQLSRARAMHNARQFDEAIAAATAARATPETADAAAVVLARAHLERYRLAEDPADLGAAREALGAVRADVLDEHDRIDFLLALGLSLYLEDDFGAAAELFESALLTTRGARPETREAVLEWLGGATERRVATASAEVRRAHFARVARRFEDELAATPGSRAAAYWLVASLRGEGALERAWDAAVAAWVRARLAGPGAANLRADLDTLVLDGLIPDLIRVGPADGREVRAPELRAEWELVKQKWR